MFKSAVIKLTLWYVGALIAVCIMFSLPLYLLSSRRLERGANHQIEFIQSYKFNTNGGAGGGVAGREPPPGDFVVFRNTQLEEDRRQLLTTTIIADLAVIILGSGLSYLFARWTLRPIEDMHEAQTRFTADASHELRTPLAVMQTEIEIVLRDKSAKEKDIRGVLASNLEEVARLRQLSDQLLELTKMDIETLHKQSFDLSTAISEEMSIQSEKHGTKIKSAIEPGIVVHGVETLIRQVVSILIDNSHKYCGKKPPIIKVSLGKQGRYAVITCEDKGVGISPEDLPKIFERFYRGTNTKNDGHGLGLSLAKEIVEKHGGSITARSTTKSTVFEVNLPA